MSIPISLPGMHATAAGFDEPFALLLPSDQARRMLLIVWGGALLGVLFRVFWSGAPRWLYVPAYVMLGWVALSLFFRAATLRLQGRGVRWPWRRAAPPEPRHTGDH